VSRPFRLNGDPDEDALHCAVANLLDVMLLPPARWTTFPAGNVKLPPAAAAKLYRMGLKRGWPDILVVHTERIFGIELKTPTGTLSYSRIVRSRRGGPRFIEGQRDVFPLLREAGMRIAVCRSPDQVLSALCAWGIPVSGRIAA
jgi:hypothetical protein